MTNATASANVDTQEVKKFDDLAAYWWDRQGPCQPLHDLNPIRLNFIQSCCHLVNQTILDVGCGGGILTEPLSQLSEHVIGIDQSESCLAVAKAHSTALANRPLYEKASAEDFAKKYPEKFDVITCLEMLEHVPAPDSVIAACCQLLKPGGHLFFSTLNRTPKAFLHAIIGAEYLLKMLPKGTHAYGQFLRPSELAAWARSHPLCLKKIKGIRYHLLSKRYSLSDDVTVNYLVHFQKDQGLP